jgi:TolA-binding protein
LVWGLSAAPQQAQSAYDLGLERLEGEDYEGALVRFRRAQELAPLSSTAINAAYFEAVVFYRQELWRAAAEGFGRVVETFPEARIVPEALYQAGICRDRLGETEAANRLWLRVIREFPDSHWAVEAQNRRFERLMATWDPLAVADPNLPLGR